MFGTNNHRKYFCWQKGVRSTMQIVINIDNNLYTRLFDNGVDNYDDAIEMATVIRNGIPLPKHHGRIIDESQIRHIECHTERELYGNKIRYVKTTDAPTIIEAEESESE